MSTTLLHKLNRGFWWISRICTDYPVSARNMAFVSLLLFTFLAPACAPNELPPERTTPSKLVLLTDTTLWENGHLEAYKDSLTAAGYRVLVSGFPGESAAELSARLPWLLQPGVDQFIYDNNLAGDAGKDSLLHFLKTASHPAQVAIINR